ncbi:hypothetical protein [Planctomycetes bacterium Pan216]
MRYLNVALEKIESINWGWKEDPETPRYDKILYVDLPQGQASFHSEERYSDREYYGWWDGSGKTTPRVMAFCDSIMARDAYGIDTKTLMPFGANVGVALDALPADYCRTIGTWDGLENWPLFRAYFARMEVNAQDLDGIV